MTTGPYTDIEFVLSSSEGRGDFIGISGSGLDKAGIGIDVCNTEDPTVQTDSVNFLSKSAGTILNVYNGPYQYASWQQVRNSYNPVVRKLVENSIFSIAATPGIRVSDVTGLPTIPKREGVLCYKLPVVRSSAKPLDHTIEVQPNINDPAITTSSFTYTYGNNLQLLINPDLQNEMGMSEDTTADSMYENMSMLYLDPAQLSLNTNPVRDFVNIDYSQVLYPSPLNAFLNRTRTRTNYSEVSGTGSNGYDRTFGAQRTFYKKDQYRTFQTALNSQGYTAAPAGTGSELVDSLNFNPMATDGIKSYPDSSSYRNRDGELMMDTDITMNRFKPVPSLSFNELNYLYNASTYVSGVFYSVYDSAFIDHKIFSRTRLSDTSWSAAEEIYDSVAFNTDANGIAVDAVNRKIYWTEYNNNPDIIRSASFDGSDEGIVCFAVGGSDVDDVRGIAVSPSANRIVWCNRESTNTIGTASLDGLLSGTLYGGLSQPEDVVLDQRSNDIYWIAAGTPLPPDRVWRGNLDGTAYIALNEPIQIILRTSTGHSNKGIDLDPLSNTLYYIGEFGTNELRIHKSDLNGDNAALVLSQPAAAFNDPLELQIDPYGRRIYFSSFTTDTEMYSCSLDNPGLDPIDNLYGAAFPPPSGDAMLRAALYFAELTASSGYVERLTEQISGRDPWYNTYEDYANDVRPIQKDMSILPEFRISEFMDYYADQKSGDFRAKNDKFLMLDGAFITASAASEESALNNSFVTKYVESSKVNKLKNMIEKHKDIGEVSNIEISCKGIKKLLPYNGFYPQNRTVQLGSLLSQSLAENVQGREDGNSTAPRTPQGLQGILKPLVSPGILYNSIKSGIAVDYPVYTGSVPAIADPSNESPSDFQFTQAPDFRLPFESIINLEGNLPVGNANDDTGGIRLVYSYATSEETGSLDLFKYKSYWDGKKKPLFELGMHNFLAETVDFFLAGGEQGGKLTSFRSQPQPERGWILRPEKTYYMDVKLSDTAPMNRFVEYQGVKTINDFNWNYERGPRANSAFGRSQKLIYAADGTAYAAMGSTPTSNITDPGHVGLYKRVDNGSGWRRVLELPNPITPSITEETLFGSAVDMVSASDGFHIIAGDSKWNNSEGRATVFHIKDEKLVTTTTVTASDATTSIKFGAKVAITHDGERTWFACGAPEDERFVTNGYAIYLYNSSSQNGFEIDPGVTASAQSFQTVLPFTLWTGPGDLQDVSICHGTAPDAGSLFGERSYIYVLASQDASTFGTGSLFATTGSPADVTYPYGSDLRITSVSLTASDGTGTGEKFGRGTAVISASDGLYTAVGGTTRESVFPAGTDLYGSIYVYRYSDDPSDWGDAGIFPLGNPQPSGEWKLTCSLGNVYEGMLLGAAYADSLGGASTSAISMLSGTDGLKVIGATNQYPFAGQPSESAPEPLGPWLFNIPLEAAPASVDAEQDLITSQSLGFSSSANPRFPYNINKGAEISGFNQTGLYGFTVSLASGTSDLAATVGAPYGTTFDNQLAGWTLGWQSSSAGGLYYSSSYSDVAFKYKQHGKLYGLAIEEEFAAAEPVGAYDPSFCSYTPPSFYGGATARISFKPEEYGAYTLQDIFDGATVENILDVEEDRMAVVNNGVVSLTDLQEKVKMPLSSSVNLFGLTKIPGTTTLPDGTTQTVDSTPDDPDAWVISTRFESPVIDTKNSRYDELYTANNDNITGTFGWQETVAPKLTLEAGAASATNEGARGLAIDQSEQAIYWTRQEDSNSVIRRVGVDGENLQEVYTMPSPATTPGNIALDTSKRHIYWYTPVADGGFQRLPMQPNSTSELLFSYQNPLHSGTAAWLQVDPVGRYFYWMVDVGTSQHIRRMSFDMPAGQTPANRTDVETLFTITGTPDIRSLTLDTSSGKMYWIDKSGGFPLQLIRSANMDGTGTIDTVFTITSSGNLNAIAIDVGRSKIYFLETLSLSGVVTMVLKKINLDGSGEEQMGIVDNFQADTDMYSAMQMFESEDFLDEKLFLTMKERGNSGNYSDLETGIFNVFVENNSEINPRTMWTSYGTVPEGEDNGLILEVKESFPESESESIGSLVEELGFIPQKYSVGQVRQTKEISEAVVVIPYLDYAATQDVRQGLTSTEVLKKELTLELQDVPGKNFFRIPEWNFDGQKENIMNKKPAVPGDQNILTGVQYDSTTVSDMIMMMDKYVIPPNFDFVRYDDIDPFVMYIFEFKHVLGRKELTDIWQGITPDSALRMENDEVKIAHRITPFEFFGNVNDQKILGDMKFFVFKAKKRAKQNYYETTEDSTDDSRFTFTFSNDPNAGAVSPKGSYNWPYDFFSLVEKASVETKVTIKKLNPPPPPEEET